MLPITITLPFTITTFVSGFTSNTATTSVSGYTGDITPFYFVPLFNNNHTFDTTKVLWDFGDGTYSNDVSAIHTYNWPGVYNVTLTTFDSLSVNIFYNSISVPVTVVNLIDELLTVQPNNVILNIPAGRLSTPLNATRYNSWQSYPSVSAVGYTLNLFVSGSLSEKLDVVNLPKNKWAHINRTWRFLKQDITQDGVIQYLPIDNIVTSNTPIYYKLYNSNIIPCDENDISAIFVGTSGACQFYYIDDTPKNYDSLTTPVNLIISLNTQYFPDSYQVSTNTIFSELEFFQHTKAILPVKIRYNNATQIIFTSSGIANMLLSKHKWQNTEIPFFIDLIDSEGFIINNYPPLTINTSLSTSLNQGVVNIGILDNNNNSLSADFFDYLEPDLPPAISGTYHGYFIPYTTSENCTLSGSVLVYNVPNYQLDSTIGWISQINTSTVFKVTPELFLPITPISNDINVFQNNVFCFAVAPSAAFNINTPPFIWCCDSDSDNLVKFDTTGSILSTVSLSTLLYNYVGSLSAKLTPSYLALDSNNNLWITLFDSSSSVKIDSSTLNVLSVIKPSTENVYYSGPERLNIFGGSDLIQPALVDIDIYNNPWICYTHPLCSFIESYTTSGHVLSTFPLLSGLTPTDLVIDRNNNVWVTAAYYTNIVPWQSNVVSPITAVKLPQQDNGFGLFKYTFNTSISSLLNGKNSIMEVRNLNDKYYNGRFLVETVSGNSIIVQPHPLAWRFASSTNITTNIVEPIQSYLISLSALSLSSSIVSGAPITKFTPSDQIIRIAPNGQTTIIDKFLSPNHITIDINQNAWITHHLMRVSMVSAGSNNISMSVECGSAQYVLEKVQQDVNSSYIAENNNGLPNHLIELLVQPPAEKIFQHLEGITNDTYNLIWILNDFEGRVYYLSTLNPTVSAMYYTDLPPPLADNYDFTRKTYQAYGDWNGGRWINKFPTFQTIQRIYGDCLLDILPMSGLWHLNKINENFDASAMYNSFRFTEKLLNSHNLFDNFIGQIVGNINSDPTTLGKLIYERIANYTGNINDIDTCDINTLYSLCTELNVPIDGYNFLLPANLKRLFNLFSIKHSKLWGGRSKFNKNFSNNYSQNSLYGTNLGPQIDIKTYTVSAGTNIVFNQLFNNEYKFITPMVLSAYTPGGSFYTYPLSTYDSSWGWGLENGVTGITLSAYYRVYSYNKGFNQTQLEGVIDWNNNLNTIQEGVSSINDWLKKDGIVETSLDWELRRGLDLFI